MLGYCVVTKGTTINDLGGAGKNREKKNSEALLQEKKFRRPLSKNKFFWKGTLQEKKISDSPSPRKKISGASLLREKKFFDPFLNRLIHVYEEKKMSVYPFGKKKFGKPPQKKFFQKASSKKKKNFEGPPWKTIFSQKGFRGKKIHLENFLRPQIINDRPLMSMSQDKTYSTECIKLSSIFIGWRKAKHFYEIRWYKTRFWSEVFFNQGL